LHWAETNAKAIADFIVHSSVVQLTFPRAQALVEWHDQTLEQVTGTRFSP